MKELEKESWKNIKSILLFVTLLFATLQSLSAQNANVKGRIVDIATGSPIKYANISLLRQDSIFLVGAKS